MRGRIRGPQATPTVIGLTGVESCCCPAEQESEPDPVSQSASLGMAPQRRQCTECGLRTGASGRVRATIEPEPPTPTNHCNDTLEVEAA